MVGSWTTIRKYVYVSLPYLHICFLLVLLKVGDGHSEVIEVFEEISYEILRNHLNLKISACRNVLMLFSRCEHILLKVNRGTSAPLAEPVFISCLVVISVTALKNERAIWLGIETEMERF